MAAERVRSHLMEHGVRYETHTHTRAYTTSEVAEAEHVPGAQMAKVVMLMAEDDLVMAVVPGNKKVNLDKAATALDVVGVRLAEEKEFSPVFADCEIGAEPPFGPLYDIPMLVDLKLDSPKLTFNAGTHEETITVAFEDYLELTKPKRADLVFGS